MDRLALRTRVPIGFHAAYTPDVSYSNPEGWLFHAPHKRPLVIAESLSMAMGLLIVYLLIRSAYRQLELARGVIEEQRAELEREHRRSEGCSAISCPTRSHDG